MTRFVTQFMEPSGSKKPKYIFLGTLAGSHCYSFPFSCCHNQMWEILPKCFGEDSLRNAFNDEKNAFLVKHAICMWDVCKSAERKSASDKDIKDEEVFDIPKFVSQYPSAKVICVGNTAYDLLHKHFPEIKSEKVCSSSGMCSIKLDEKIKRYKEVLQL